MSLLLISVYKSPKKDEMFLYVAKGDLAGVPAELLQMFGAPVHVMDIPLRPGRDLARVSSDKLRQEIEGNGFYLQMPPPKEDYLLDLYNPDDSKYRDLP